MREAMLAIAHAGGSLTGEPYTNSLEAMNAAYARGLRWFELDFKRTADGAVGCRHDWGAFGGEAPTLAGLRERFAGRFTPMAADDLAAWMAARPDTTLVTDVKEDDQLPVLADLAAAGVPQDRTVVQLFDPEEDARVADAGFARRSIILYRMDLEAEGEMERLRRLVRPGMPVGLSLAQARAGLHRELPGAASWVYTVDDAETVRALAASGVQAVFTDDLTPGEHGLTAEPLTALFSYGTLADPAVQRAVFGTVLPSEPARLPGYRPGTVTITDPVVIAASGSDAHPGAVPTGEAGDVIGGVVLMLTPEQLVLADAYEAAGYDRRLVTLEGGQPAHLYAPKEA